MKLTKVDQLILGSQEHWHLDLSDDCYFFGEYTARARYSGSEVNQFILNFKKSMDRKAFPYEWKYKGIAIRQAANYLAAGLGKGPMLPAIRGATLVPVPPSKVPGDPLHDDRIAQMLSQLNLKIGNLDIRPLVRQHENYESSHLAGCRPTPTELEENYSIDEDFTDPEPSSIWIFDDLLVTGSHYKAMVNILSQRFPDAEFVGIFLARRITDD